jgi:WD40 repeat protein
MVASRQHFSVVETSHDSKTVASASYGNTISLRDAATGACTATLEIGKVFTYLVFDKTGSSLLIDIGRVAGNTPVSRIRLTYGGALLKL